MADAAFVVQDNVHGFLRIIGYFDKVEVAGADEAVLVLHIQFSASAAVPSSVPSRKG